MIHWSLVRVARLELAASWSQTRRPTSWATPGNIQLLLCADIEYILYTSFRKKATINFLAVYWFFTCIRSIFHKKAPPKKSFDGAALLFGNKSNRVGPTV